MRTLIVSFTAVIAACGPEPVARPEEPSGPKPTAEAEPPQPHPVGRASDTPAPPPPVPSLPGLKPLSEAQVLKELGSGASCTLTDGGVPLMVAMLRGVSIVNEDGKVVRLETEAKDWKALVEGGRFAADGITLEVKPGTIVAQQDGLVERDAAVTLTRGRRGFNVSHGPWWACGS